MHTLYIEGNIGIGKSSIGPLIADMFNAEFIPEPVNEWQQVTENGKNLIENFYNNMTRYAFSFQSYALLTRLMSTQDYNSDYSVVERSIFSDHHVFAQNCFDNNLLNETEWEIYQKWFEWSSNMIPTYVKPPEAVFIYLRAPPETCLQRAKSRNRLGEKNITLDYLTQIHNKHESWLGEHSNENRYIIDASGSIEETLNNCKRIKSLLQ